MYHDHGIRRGFPYGANARTNVSCHVPVSVRIVAPSLNCLPSRGPQETIRHFIPYLHHFGTQAFLLKGLHRIQGKIIHCLLKSCDIISSPGLGHPLLTRVRPEVTVMEVKQYAHPKIPGPPCKLNGGLKVIGAGPIRSTVLPVRIVPYTQPYRVASVPLKYLQCIVLGSVIEKPCPACLFLQ